MKATFKLLKDCKHSRRFQCADKDFPVKDIYVARPWADRRNEFVLEIKEENSSEG